MFKDRYEITILHHTCACKNNSRIQECVRRQDILYMKAFYFEINFTKYSKCKIGCKLHV